MKTLQSPIDIRNAAVKVIGIEFNQLLGREMSPLYLPRAREAIVGVMFSLGRPTPTLMHLSNLTGRRHHTTVRGQLRRYKDNWPPRIRTLWEHAVLIELDWAV